MIVRAALAAALLLAACARGPDPAAAAPAPEAPPPRPSAPAPAPAGEASWGEPESGLVKKLFRTRHAEVKRCYEAALAREPSLRGRFTLRFTISPGGALEDVSVAGSTFGRREVPECVAAVVRRWRTPFRPAEPVAVEYPFRFAPR
ncbi:MAG TPA: AgmX/PglI C-terminal domain-containing protein [Anaeromyxobacter sp.]